MNKSISLLFASLATTILFATSSCVKKAGSSELSEEDAQKVDTIWNEKIQDTFFGAKFGASRQDVIQSLTAHGFTPFTEFTDNKSLISFKSSTDYFSFGGLIFKYLNVYFNNDKFESIKFYQACGEFKNKQAKIEAIKKAKDYTNALEGKYELTKNIIGKEDSASVFYKCAVFAKNGTIWVSARMEHSLGDDALYYSDLLYVSKAVSEEPNKEL